MKFAVVVDKEGKVSQHFGSAARFVVFSQELETVSGREERLVEAGLTQQGCADEAPAGEMDKPTRLISLINDCTVMIVGGMCANSHAKVSSRGIKPILTELLDVDEAARAFASGSLLDHPERLH